VSSILTFAVLLGTPLVGALLLGLLGAKRWAPALNVLFSALTFLAASALTSRVITHGNLVVMHEQFFIDAFNVFLVTLTAFVEVGQQDTNHLFVPFGDLTNGTETYPGGRYLELDRTPTGIYDLDFNRAYHPFCYYNPKYDCPYPPRENRLPTPIRAGERMGAAKH